MKRFLMCGLLLMLLPVFLAAAGCATSQEAANEAANMGQSVRNRGGDADSGATKVNTLVAVAQPTGDALVSMVENEDQSSNAQAGDSPTLVIGGSRAALAYLSAPDPVQDGMASRLAAMNDQFADPPEGTDMVALTAAIEALEDRMMAHATTKLENAASMAGNFSSLSSIVFQVIQFKANGAPSVKLSADVVREAAASLAIALAPATAKASQ